MTPSQLADGVRRSVGIAPFAELVVPASVPALPVEPPSAGVTPVPEPTVFPASPAELEVPGPDWNEGCLQPPRIAAATTGTNLRMAPPRRRTCVRLPRGARCDSLIDRCRGSARARLATLRE